MTPNTHCSHEHRCDDYEEYCNYHFPCPAYKCGKDTRACHAAPANQSERLPPCPKCGGFTFCANIDDEYQILCMNDECKWKQKITAQPPASPDTLDKRISDLNSILNLTRELKRKYPDDFSLQLNESQIKTEILRVNAHRQQQPQEKQL